MEQSGAPDAERPPGNLADGSLESLPLPWRIPLRIHAAPWIREILTNYLI
jgi:hypothetical protein